MSEINIAFELQKPFPEQDIEWRIGQCGLKQDGSVWAKCLAYIQARAVMERFDEIFGPLGWSPSYQFIEKSGVIGNISVYDSIKMQWVSKEDGAEMTDIEAFKGGISSALKRAGSVWGVGRYLYKLEADFADVRMGNTPGYNYAKTKEGKAFWWKPPALPDWAMPKKDTMFASNIGSAGMSGPTPFDDVPPPTSEYAHPVFGQLAPTMNMAKEFPDASSSAYRFKGIKKYIGKTLNEVPKWQLENDYEFWSKQKITVPNVQDDFNAIAVFLGKATP